MIILQQAMELQWLALIIPVSYILISTFFFCFPIILHKKYRYQYPPFNDLIETNQIFCIGHRGGGWEGPENTLELFHENCHRMHMFELDVCLTKDEQLVVHHDANVLRTCGQNVLIAQTNYSDLPRFKPQFQSFGGPVIKSQSNKIPLLEDLFDQFPQKPMNIELKTPSETAIAEFNRLVKKYSRESITVWGIAGSMNEQLRMANPRTVNFYSGGETLKIFVLFIFGLLPFACLRQGVLDIPLITEDFYRMAMNFTDSKCGKCLIWTLFLVLKCFNCLSWLFIRHLKKRGILTFYFILNHEKDYESAIQKGCSGIMTDSTRHLHAYLTDRGLLYRPSQD